MIPLESPVPEIGPPGSESGGRKRTHGTRPAARLRKRRISHRPLPATRLSSTLPLVLPDRRELRQKGSSLSSELPGVPLPDWVERAHLGPVSGLNGWEAMTGTSTVGVLYRGVFVQKFDVKGLWGIEGTIDVDPKHFKPRLNREGFVEGQFRSEVTEFLQTCHPVILDALVRQLRLAFERGALGRWTVKRWANLWLSLPRNEAYRSTCQSWDAFFRSIPAFEVAVGGKWRPIAFDEIKGYSSEIYLAPLPDKNPDDVTQAALRLLRSTGRVVIRGIRHDRGWMRYASRSFGTTADLISSVFGDQMPALRVDAKIDSVFITWVRWCSSTWAGRCSV